MIRFKQLQSKNFIFSHKSRIVRTLSIRRRIFVRIVLKNSTNGASLDKTKALKPAKEQQGDLLE
jgi:hypothetical protein